jgi:dihydroflavonol-4-reductase
MVAFVTGATGLLGSNLVRLLIEQGYQVRALVRSARKAASVFSGMPVEFIENDVRNVADYQQALVGCDVVFHTAAFFREYFQPGDHWKTLEATNITATIDLLRAAERQGVKKVIYTSSSGVIGMQPGADWGDESCAPDAHAMENLYFRSKVIAEQEIATFLKTSQLPVVLILPGWMFGPSDTAPTSSGQIVRDFLAQRLPGILDGGGSPVDVRDVAQGMINAVARGISGERYIIGGDRFVTFRELLETLQQVSGVAAPTMPIPYAISLVYAWVSEQYGRITGKPVLATVNGVRTLKQRRQTRSDKAVRELGVTFRPLSETLRDEVTWFRANEMVSHPATV